MFPFPRDTIEREKGTYSPSENDAVTSGKVMLEHFSAGDSVVLTGPYSELSRRAEEKSSLRGILAAQR
jgi:hypothetical protein